MEVRKLTTADEYNDFIKNEETVNVVKFSASWCGPCRVLADTLSDLSEEKIAGRARFSEIDVDDDEFENICSVVGIRGVPVLAYFVNGELVKKTIGLRSAGDIYNDIESLFVCSA